MGLECPYKASLHFLVLDAVWSLMRRGCRAQRRTHGFFQITQRKPQRAKRRQHSSSHGVLVTNHRTGVGPAQVRSSTQRTMT